MKSLKTWLYEEIIIKPHDKVTQNKALQQSIRKGGGAWLHTLEPTFVCELMLAASVGVVELAQHLWSY